MRPTSAGRRRLSGRRDSCGWHRCSTTGLARCVPSARPVPPAALAGAASRYAADASGPLALGPGFPGFCVVVDHRGSTVLIAVSHVRPFGRTAPTMASADFSLRPAGVALSGMRRDLPGYHAPAFPLMPVGYTPRRLCKYRALASFATSPQRVASYPLPVPRIKSGAGYGQRFASGFLPTTSHPSRRCLWLTLPLAG